MASASFAAGRSNAPSCEFALQPEKIDVLGVANHPRTLMAFIQKVSKDLEAGILRCVKVQKIKNTLLCFGKTQSTLHDYFGRASLFIEGMGASVSTGNVFRPRDAAFKDYRKLIAGFDLKKKDMEKFYKEIDRHCAKDPRMCLSEKETALRELVENHQSPIIIAAYTKDPWLTETISHEILHAMYFSNPKYKKVLTEFWNEIVSAQDRKAIVAELGTVYDVKDSDLMVNEFFAYLMQKENKDQMLNSYTEKYKAPLRQEMANAGLEIWDFQSLGF